MKKIISLGLLLVTTLSLTACSSNNKQSTSTHRNNTTKVDKKKAPNKKKSKKSKKKKVTAKETTNTSESQQQTTNQQQNNQPTQQATQEQPNQQSDNISYDENTLTGFINKYGMSPAAYKSEHDGMSAYEALKSTPDYMETFGEKQTESQLDRGLMDHNGNMTDKGMQWENHTDDQSDQNYDTDY